MDADNDIHFPFKQNIFNYATFCSWQWLSLPLSATIENGHIWFEDILHKTLSIFRKNLKDNIFFIWYQAEWNSS